jgi:antitoxin (DNA-binding transcriptional repressor) of toxin-antitoxin stability system
MAVLESDIKALFKTITSETMKTVSAGQKTIISPTTVRNLAKEITEQAESGSIFKFEDALKKTEAIIDKLGINLDDFNKGLSDRIKQLGEQKVKAEAEVQELRQSNIAAEVKTIKEGKEFRIETNILTRKEIKERTNLLNQQIKQTDKREKEIIKEREKLLKKDELTTADKEKIVADEKEITQRRAAIATESETLGLDRTADTGGNRLEMPPMLAAFVDGLKTPFTAVAEAGLQLKDTIMGIGETFMFLGKGSLLVLVKAFKALSFILKPIPLAIGAAIGGAIFLILKFKDSIGDFVDAVKSIPGKIKNFFTEAFRMVKNFFIDAINGIISLINKVKPGKDIELLERDEGPAELDPIQQQNEAKKDMQAIIKEAEEDQAQKEKILKDLEIPDAPSFTVPNLNLNERNNANLEFANAGTGSSTVINNVIGGSQQNVSSNSSSINNLSSSGNIDKTFINLQTVPV